MLVNTRPSLVGSIVISLSVHLTAILFLLCQSSWKFHGRLQGGFASGHGVEVTLANAPPVSSNEVGNNLKQVEKVRSDQQRSSQHHQVLTTRRMMKERVVHTTRVESPSAGNPVNLTPSVSQSSPTAPTEVRTTPSPIAPFLSQAGTKSVPNATTLGCRIPQPIYSPKSRRLGNEGTVVLNVVVGMSGAITNVSLVKTSGYDELDQSAIEAVMLGQCDPYLEAGQPHLAQAEQSIKFSLTK